MTLLVVTIVVALAFDFTNGFHDTANAVATSVSTRALSPRMAVLIAAIANLVGAFATTAVAKTVGQGIIDTNLATPKTVLAAVIGAIAWNLLTWWFGLPSSSSHALIGGLIGAALVQSGEAGVQWHDIVHKRADPGRLGAGDRVRRRRSCCCSRIYWGLQWLTPGVANRSFRHGQLLSGTWVAFTHGVERRAEDDGRDRARALLERLDRLVLHPDLGQGRGRASRSPPAPTPAGIGSCARSASASSRWSRRPGSPPRRPPGAVIWGSTKAGYPLSTTHVVSGAVMGSGATKRLSAVRWGVAGNIVLRVGPDDPGGGRRLGARLVAGRGDLLVRIGFGSGSSVIFDLLGAGRRGGARSQPGGRAAHHAVAERADAGGDQGARARGATGSSRSSSARRTASSSRRTTAMT